VIVPATLPYAGAPAIRADLPHTFKPGRIILVLPPISHVVLVRTDPKVDLTIVTWISVNMVHFKEVAGLQPFNQTRKDQYPQHLIPVLCLPVYAARHPAAGSVPWKMAITYEVIPVN
jgi:hypothetical protein